MMPVVYLPVPPCECVHCTMRALLLNRALRTDPRYAIFGVPRG